jgi:hypothetical protein
MERSEDPSNIGQMARNGLAFAHGHGVQRH